MNLHQLRTMLAEMELQIEELQRATFTLNHQLMRAQIQAEEIAKKGQKLLDWATQQDPSQSEPTHINRPRA
jgi:hypothetical protein